MVTIGEALQNRLFDAAKRHLGASGDMLVQETAQETFGRPLHQLTHTEAADLLRVLERRIPERLGQDVSRALAQDLYQLQGDADAGFSGRLIGAASKRVGPAAEPLLRRVCARLGRELETVGPEQTPELAAAVQADAAPLLGADTAQALATALLEAGRSGPANLLPGLLTLARQHLGEDGEAVVRRICRGRLEVDLDDLDGTAIRVLAQAVEEAGPAVIGQARAIAFHAAARLAVASPAQPLRQRILELANRAFGPAGPDIVRDACAAEGVPFEAIDYEHLMWLAEVLRAGAAPLLGKKGADDLAASIRVLLTGREARRSR